MHINAAGNRQKIVTVVAAAPEAKEEIASLVSTPREKQFAGVLWLSRAFEWHRLDGRYRLLKAISMKKKTFFLFKSDLMICQWCQVMGENGGRKALTVSSDGTEFQCIGLWIAYTYHNVRGKNIY